MSPLNESQLFTLFQLLGSPKSSLLAGFPKRLCYFCLEINKPFQNKFSVTLLYWGPSLSGFEMKTIILCSIPKSLHIEIYQKYRNRNLYWSFTFLNYE